MQKEAETSLRLQLRELLAKHGVTSNPGWADVDIVEALGELLNNRKPKRLKKLSRQVAKARARLSSLGAKIDSIGKKMGQGSP